MEPRNDLVLVVEDDLEVREMLARLLVSAGYAVRTAGDGLDALKQLRAGLSPAVITLDLAMPRMNGWEFREVQRRDRALARIPVVVLSVLADRPGIDCDDADAVLLLPAELDVVVSTVARVCGHRPVELPVVPEEPQEAPGMEETAPQ